jgi:hypothetical protein
VRLRSERRQQLVRTAQKHERGASHEQFLLACYSLVLTNVPAELLRLWKQQGVLAAWRLCNPWRVLCEVYAKLLGLLIQHWVLLLSCWHDPHRSLVKAAKAVHSHAIILAYALVGEFSVESVLHKIQRATRSSSRLKRRKMHPNTS